MVASVRSLSNLTGLILSVACVIHCMLMPVLLASLPDSGLSCLSHPYVHQFLALLGVGLGLWTLIPGWRRHQRHPVLILAGVGLLVMNYAAFFGEDCCGNVAANSSEVPACCQHGVCTLAETEATGTNAAPGPHRESAASAMVFASWLWQHPTACGAALLAWAHCLNGACRQRCCRQA